MIKLGIGIIVLCGTLMVLSGQRVEPISDLVRGNGPWAPIVLVAGVLVVGPFMIIYGWLSIRDARRERQQNPFL